MAIPTEPPSPEPTAPRLPVLDSVLAHHQLRWSAEEENGRRLGTRSGQLLTLATAMLVLGLFKIGAAIASDESPPPAYVSILGGLATLFLVLAIKEVMRFRWAIPSALQGLRNRWTRRRLERSRRGSPELEIEPQPHPDAPATSPLASSLLAWPESISPVSEGWRDVDLYEATLVRTLTLEDAAGRLHQLNLQYATSLGRAQERLLIAAVCLGLTVLGYLGAALGASTPPDGDCKTTPVAHSDNCPIESNAGVGEETHLPLEAGE